MRGWMMVVMTLVAGCALAAGTETPKPPATPAGAKLGWFLDALNQRHGAVEVGELKQQFSDQFLAQVPVETLHGMFEQLGGSLPPLSLGSVEEQGPDALVAHLSSPQGAIDVRLKLDASSKKFDGLRVMPGTTPAPAPAEASASAPAAVAAPSTPAGEKLQWFLRAINERQGKVDPAELEKLFSPTFLAQVPVAQLTATFGQLAEGFGPLKLESVEEKSPLALRARAQSKQGPVNVSVVVGEAVPHLFEGLLIRPAEPPAPRPASWDAVKQSLGQLAPKVSLLAARIEKDACVPVQQVNANAELAIGSTFKLYVLRAAAEQIAKGKLSWDTPIAVREDWKSWPSGTLQNQPAGTKMPLRQVAQQMIAISDNTAADHLLRTVGREAVESAVAKTAHAEPARDRPFLTTREMFALKLGQTDEQRRHYLALDLAGRRAYLAKIDGQPLPPLSRIGEWKVPRDIDTLEWFASARDLCQAMVSLRAAGKSDPTSETLKILSRNPGVDPGQGWSYVGFKGGSEPGVMNLTFLVRRQSDGAWFVLSLGANDASKDVEQGKLVAIAEGALALLAKP